MASIDRLEIQIEAQANKANQSLEGLIKKLDRLSASLSGVNSRGLATMASGVNKLANAMTNINANTNTASFTRLANNLNKLNTVDTSKFNAIASAMNVLTTSLNRIGTVSQSAVEIAEIAKSLSKFGNSNTQRAIENMPQLANALTRLMSTLSTAPRVNTNIIQMTNALANFSAQGRRAGTAATSLTGSITRYSSAAARSSKGTKSLAASIGRLYAFVYLAIRAVKGLGKAIGSSMDFLETVNYFEVAMRQIGDSAASSWKEAGYNSAEEYAESFSQRAKQLTEKMTGYAVDKEGNAEFTGNKSLGMDPSQVMQYQAVFAQMSNSIGVAEESAMNFSKALTMLGADWASLRNTTFNQSWEKFASALAGQSRAVRSFGIDITMATLQEVAYANGVRTAVSEMNQATKAQLRLLAIMEQSEVAFGDLANTIGSPSNQLRMLQQNFSNLARAIGNLFLPVITKVLPYINGLVMALQRLFSWIGRILGIKFESINSAIGGAGDNIGDIVGDTDDLEDSLGGAEKAAKKLKGALASFDEINNRTTKDESDGGSGGGKPSAGGGIPELDTAIADALAEYEKKWQEAFDRMDNKAQEFADNVVAWFKKIWEIAEPTRAALSRLWNEGLKQLAGFSFDTLRDFYKNFLVPVGKWMLGDNAGLPRLFNVLNKMLTDIDWGRLRNSLYKLYESMSELAIFAFDALFDFVEYFLAPLGTWVLSSALPQLADILRGFIDDINWEKINASLERFWKALLPFAKAIGQGMINFFQDLAKVGAAFINIIVPGGLNALSAALEMFDPRTIERIGYALGVLLAAYLGFKAVTKVSGIISGAFAALHSPQLLSGLRNVTTRMMGLVNTIPIATSALTGNRNAANALATFYPRLNRQIAGVSSAFETFRANLGSGAFFSNTLTDLRNWGAGLSGIAKGAIGVTAVFAEFNIIKNVFEDMALGTENVAIGIGKIAIAAGIAAAALKLIGLSNPWTIAIVGITGVVAGIMGINDAMKQVETESIGNSIKNALTVPGGTPLSELSAGFATVMEGIGGSFSIITEKSAGLEQADSNIRNTWLEIEKIETAMDAGVLSVEEGKVELTRLFGELATTAGEKFGALEDTLLAAFGENGVLSGVYDRLGISTENTTSTIIELNDKVEKRIKELTKLLSETEPTNPNYALYREELAELMTQTDELTTAMGNYDLALSQINYSDLVGDDGKLDDAKLQEFLDDIATATKTANTDVTAGIAGIKTALTEELNAALAVGDMESAEEFQTKINALPDALTLLKEDIALKSVELTDTVQKDLVGGMSDVIKQAGEEWENNSFPFKGDKSTFVSDAVREYQNNFLSPVSGQIESTISQFGIDGAGWSKAAGEKIMEGLFDVTQIGTVGYSGAAQNRVTLKDNYESIITGGINDAKPGIIKAANESAGFLVDGYQETIASAEIDASNMVNTAATSVQNAQDSHSPSKLSMGFGKDWVDGYNLGITENAKSSETAIALWMDSIKAYFTEDTWTSLFSGMTLSFQTQWGIFTEWWNGEALPVWWEEGVTPWFSAEKWTEITEGMKTGILAQWTQFTELWKAEFTNWWTTDIVPWFSLEKWQLFGTNMKKGMFAGFKGILSSVSDILNKIIKSFEDSMKNIIKSINDFGASYNGMAASMGNSPVPKLNNFSIKSIPQYQAGGFPEDGLFMANHNELVGQFSNGDTAVINNGQIIEGVKRGVYEAVKEAMAQSDNTTQIKIGLEPDSYGLFKIVREESNKFINSTGESPF